MRKDEHRSRKPSDAEKAKHQFFFDEFGPICHEVREYRVKFDKGPVLHSRLYLSNDYQILLPEYSSDPFGAKFVVANAARQNAIVNGEDTLAFGPQNAINQHFLIYGRALVQKEAETVTERDESAIQRRGRIATEISSKWVQSKEAASDLGAWINEHWSNSADEVNATIFGNPLIEVGDVVSVEYPEISATADTHRYFVIGVSNSFDDGIETTLLLRRARNYTI